MLYVCSTDGAAESSEACFGNTPRNLHRRLCPDAALRKRDKQVHSHNALAAELPRCSPTWTVITASRMNQRLCPRLPGSNTILREWRKEGQIQRQRTKMKRF